MHDPSHQSDLRVLGRLDRFETFALTATASLVVLVQLAALIPSLDSFASGALMHMRPATGAGLLLAVCALALSRPGSSAEARRIASIAGWALFALGVSVLASHSVPEMFRVSHWFRPPSQPTSLTFIAAGIALGLVNTSGRTIASQVADIAALAFAGLVLFLIGGYLFGFVAFADTPTTVNQSPPTLVCSVLLAACINGRRASQGVLLAILVNRGIGSQMVRMALPGIVLMPFATFLLVAWLDGIALFPANHTRAILAPLLAIVILAVTAWMGLRTNSLERQLRMQSLTDLLTGLLNRRGFSTIADYAMRNAVRNNAPLTVFYFDLDGLKQANDSLGHNAGNALIKAFAETLTATFRDTDVIARIGGDEFVALTAGSTETARQVLRRFADRIAQKNAAGGSTRPLAYSVGFAHRDPGGSGTVDDLVAAADREMYAAKASKKAA